MKLCMKLQKGRSLSLKQAPRWCDNMEEGHQPIGSITLLNEGSSHCAAHQQELADSGPKGLLEETAQAGLTAPKQIRWGSEQAGNSKDSCL